MTVKQCRNAKKLSCQDLAKGLNIGVEEYLKYEENPEEMPIMIGIAFSLIVGIPYDNIFFGSIV